MSELNRTYRRLLDAGVAYSDAKIRMEAAEREVVEAATAYSLFLLRGESASPIPKGDQV